MSLASEQSQTAPRRSILKYLLTFSIVTTLGGVLTPIISYLWPPMRQTTVQGSRVRVASLKELEAAGGLITAVEGQAIVLTYSQNSVKAFSAICTHLGCIVQWESAGKYIQCPCHDGRFNAQTGAVISGPPPAPLPPRETVVDGDDVFVII